MFPIAICTSSFTFLSLFLMHLYFSSSGFISSSLTSDKFLLCLCGHLQFFCFFQGIHNFLFSSLVGVSCLVLLISSVLAFLAAISSSSSLMSPLLLDRLSSCRGLLNVGEGMLQELPISFFPVSLQPLSPFASSSSPDAILDQLVSHTPYAFQISAHHIFFLFPFSAQPLFFHFFSSHHPRLRYVSWESVVELVLLGDKLHDSVTFFFFPIPFFCCWYLWWPYCSSFGRSSNLLSIIGPMQVMEL